MEKIIECLNSEKSLHTHFFFVEKEIYFNQKHSQQCDLFVITLKHQMKQEMTVRISYRNARRMMNKNVSKGKTRSKRKYNVKNELLWSLVYDMTQKNFNKCALFTIYHQQHSFTRFRFFALHCIELGVNHSIFPLKSNYKNMNNAFNFGFVQLETICV